MHEYSLFLREFLHGGTRRHVADSSSFWVLFELLCDDEHPPNDTSNVAQFLRFFWSPGLRSIGENKSFQH